MTKIIQKEHPILRQPASAVPVEEIGTPALRQLLARMSQALAAEPDGIALAAPQLGVAKRIFIVSARIFDGGAKNQKSEAKPDLVFINPRLVKLSKKRQLVEEGCLSARWWYGRVSRAEKASIEAYEENGKKFIRHSSGLMAQIFQHEMDHLAGVLFTDKAAELKEVKPEVKND